MLAATTGFLGRNGAGKTTTIRILMGIVRPDRGTIAILGRPTRRPSVAQKRLIGYVAQEQHFYPWMSCPAVGRFAGGFYPNWDEVEFARLLDAFELPPLRKVSQLSHGMSVKLALALALAPRPPLPVLDEPTADLDPVARREFLEIVDGHARQAGRTVLLGRCRIPLYLTAIVLMLIADAGGGDLSTWRPLALVDGLFAVDRQAIPRAASAPPEAVRIVYSHSLRRGLRASLRHAALLH
ncbi:MAG: ABC transporter ATP-binding protein [Candidatus Eisenbacteria bacterium]|nr:ABC transporter ATP-binding protein [Candidatus Eisenbacteria bacterium]